MTYKTLRRKSDKKWMIVNDEIKEVLQIVHPDLWSLPNLIIEWIMNGREQYCDWSDIELIEVSVIPVEDMPDDTIRDEMDKDMEESGMAQGEIESCLTHWFNKYLIIRKP